MFWMANRGPVYRHDLNSTLPALACELLERSEFFAPFSSMWHQESGAANFRRTFGRRKRGCVLWITICACAKRVRVLGIRRFGDRRYGRRGAWEATTIWHGGTGGSIPF